MMPQAQARLTMVLNLITAELEQFEADWKEKKLPKLQARAHYLWRKGQKAECRDAWQWELAHCKVGGGCPVSGGSKLAQV